MNKIDNDEIKELISIDTFDDTSLFAVSVIDVDKYEIIYANQAMKNILSDMTAENCWEAIHGQESPCLGCKVPGLLEDFKKWKHHSQSTMDKSYVVYENFNEVANRWYQIQEKVVRLKNAKNVLISFALDISLQKEAQSKLIDTHVKLLKQTEALKEAQTKLKEQANRDPLTHLYNRRYFSGISHKILAITKRTKEPLSLMMIDIDKFKRINDTYGHAIGDEVIKSLAKVLESKIRESDIVARFGGEEFVIILPNTDIDSTMIFAQNLREEIERTVLDTAVDKISFTVSIGLDTYNFEEDENIGDLLNRADKALYTAKAQGRNRVCHFNI